MLDLPFFGLTRSVAALSGGGGPAWTPASLSPLVWVEADPAKLYTDAGTTLVSADGQAVYQANDKSGNANHLIQATLGSRPLYRTGSGKPYLEFDHTDDFMATAAAIAAGDGSGQNWIAVSGYVTSIADNEVFASGTSYLQSAAGVLTGASSKADWSAGASDTGGTITAATPFVAFFNTGTSAVEVFLDNVSAGSTANSFALRTDPRSFTLGAQAGGGSDRLGGRIYGVVFGTGILNSTDRGNLQTYLAALHP
jgi:hypothetical protein